MPATAAPISWGAATIIAGDSDVSTDSDLVYAYHWATIDRTVNGVTFTGTNSVTAGGGDVQLSGFPSNYNAFTSLANPFAALSTDYKATLAGSNYNSGATVTVTLNNLNAGQPYVVQVWCNDSRVYGSGRAATLASTGGNSMVLDYNSTDSDGGVGQYSIGTFVADAVTQTFTIASGSSAQLNALQVRLSGPDETPPNIISKDPLDDSSGVYPAADLVATFSENIAFTGTGTITVTNGSDTRIISLDGSADDGDASISQKTLTIRLDANLNYGSSYEVLVSGNAIVDLAAVPNAFAGTVAGEWNFTTAAQDITAPVIVTKVPGDNATVVPVFNNIVATFDDELVLGSGNITIHNVTLGSAAAVIAITDTSQVTLAGDVLTINPAALLNTSTEYAVQMDAGVVKNFSDLPAAAIADTTTWSFTTQAVATYTWIHGGVVTNWNDPNNWEGGAVPPQTTPGTNLAYVPATSGNISSADSVNDSNKVTVGSVSWASSFNMHSFGSWTSTETGWIIDSGTSDPATFTFSNGGFMSNYYGTWKLNSDLLLSGTGAGGGLQVHAASNLVVGAGGFIVEAGTLRFDNTHTAEDYSYTGGVTVRNTGVVDVNTSNEVLGEGPLTVEEGGQVQLVSGNLDNNANLISLVVLSAGANPPTNTTFLTGSPTIVDGFTFDLSAAGGIPGNQWQIATASANYDAAFTVASTIAGAWTKTAGVWSGTEDGVGYSFDTATGILEVVSAAAYITSFEGAGATGVIDQNAFTIALEVPFGTNLATLAPTFTLSSGTCNQTSGAVPSPTFAAAPGNPVDYVVTDTATDPDTVNTYAVTVTVGPEIATLVIDLGTSPAGTAIEGGAFIGSGPTNLPLPALPAGSILKSIAVDAALEATDNGNYASDFSLLLDPTPGTPGGDFSVEITNGTGPLGGAALDLNWPTGADAGPVTPLIDTKTAADWAAAGPIDLSTTGLFLGNAFRNGGWTSPQGGTWSGTITLTYVVGSGGSAYSTWAGGEPFGGDANGDGVANGLAFLLGAATPATDAAGLLPSVGQSGGGLVMEFDCLATADRGASALTLQYDGDLAAPWTSVPVPGAAGNTTVGTVSFDATANGSLIHIVATVDDATAAAAGKLFGRLQGTE